MTTYPATTFLVFGLIDGRYQPERFTDFEEATAFADANFCEVRRQDEVEMGWYR